MAETSKNKIYYNDNENSVADVLADMKKMANSIDKAIENSRYDDTQTKKDISNIQKEQTTQNTDISNIKKEQETQNTNIEENNSKIVELQTEKAKLETELKEMQEDFYQNSIRGQASGEYIHVEDSSNCRAKIGISGNSEKETSTQGKNYFTGNKIPGGSNFGVNYSFDNSILKLNGTMTNNGNIILDKPTKVKLPAGTYTYTIKVKSGTFKRPSGDFAVYIMSASNTFITGDYANSGITGGELTQKKGTVSHIFNLTEEKEIYLRCYTSNANIVFNNLELEIQIESGSVYTGFKQFVPNMPSSDYLSEIKAVGSNVNMFNKDNYIKSKLYINKNENKFSEASMGKSFIFDISKYNKLTISKVSTERFGVFASVDYPQKDGVGTYLQDVATKTTSFTYDFTEFNYLVVMYYLTSDTITEQQILDSIKIVEGTDIGEYSKYGQGSVKVTKCNKNLINKNLLTNYQILEDTGKLLSNNTRLITPFIYLKKGTYSLSCNLSRFAYAIYNLDKSFNCFVTWKAFPNQIVLNSDCYIKIEFIINPTGSEQVSIKDITYLQLEKGNTTDYEEHEEQSYIMPIQQPMRSIGDIRDTFIKKENKWYERHYVQRLILNGTEGWNYDKNNNRFYFAKAGNKGSGYIMSSHYLRGDTTKQNNTCEIWSSAILFRDERFTEREDFKNMIKAKYDEGIPVYVDYVSITPTDIECTEEQSQILDELNNARTYKNVTNITTDSKAILDLDYAKDPETQNQKMQNEIDEIKQLLSTTQTSALLLDNLQKEVESEVE